MASRDRTQRSRVNDGPAVRHPCSRSADVRREMPTRVEINLDLEIVVADVFEIVVERVDADRVPVSKLCRFTAWVPGPQYASVFDFNQQPPARSRTEAGHSEQVPIVVRLFRSPQLAFL